MARVSSRAAIALLAAALCAPAAGAVETPLHGVAGKVLSQTSPLPTASVYAFQLADSSLHKVVTDRDGNFLFDALPAGLYRIIAHKPGFLPGVVMLTRTTADAYQFLEVELSREKRPGAVSRDDFWSVRSQIPADVLRDIKIAELDLGSRTAAPGAGATVPARLAASMEAVTGVDQIAADGESQVTGGKLGIQGSLGGVRVGLKGDYLQLEPGGFGRSDFGNRSTASGEASALSLEMADASGTEVQVMSLSNRLVNAEIADFGPVDFERYGVKVSRPFGERSRSDFTAQYTSQTNFHRQGLTDPVDIPGASRSWRFEGSYTTSLTDRATIQTGIRYRELASTMSEGDLLLGARSREQIDLYGRGGLRVQPAVLLEYGLYTALRDGGVSLIPRGGVVLQLGPSWQASTVVSHKVSDQQGTDPLLDFVPAYFEDTGACDQNERGCYQMVFTRQKSDTESLSFGAIQRDFDDTRRLYFSHDFFNRLESLYLVPGDQVPEAQFAVSRQLTPNILTRLESSVGRGGGGVFYAADASPYENRVAYLVTSLDTEFKGTATGVFLAFHRLQQDLNTLADDGALAEPSFESERLQLTVTQNLNILLDLAADWALQLNMELSRGTSISTPGNDGELRRRLLGGIAIRF